MLANGCSLGRIPTAVRSHGSLALTYPLSRLRDFMDSFRKSGVTTGGRDACGPRVKWKLPVGPDRIVAAKPGSG